MSKDKFKKEGKIYQNIIIPKGSVSLQQTAVIEIPADLKDKRTLLATPKKSSFNVPGGDLDNILKNKSSKDGSDKIQIQLLSTTDVSKKQENEGVGSDTYESVKSNEEENEVKRISSNFSSAYSYLSDIQEDDGDPPAPVDDNTLQTDVDKFPPGISRESFKFENLDTLHPWKFSQIIRNGYEKPTKLNSLFSSEIFKSDLRFLSPEKLFNFFVGKAKRNSSFNIQEVNSKKFESNPFRQNFIIAPVSTSRSSSSGNSEVCRPCGNSPTRSNRTYNTRGNSNVQNRTYNVAPSTQASTFTSGSNNLGGTYTAVSSNLGGTGCSPCDPSSPSSCFNIGTNRTYNRNETYSPTRSGGTFNVTSQGTTGGGGTFTAGCTPCEPSSPSSCFNINANRTYNKNETRSPTRGGATFNLSTQGTVGGGATFNLPSQGAAGGATFNLGPQASNRIGTGGATFSEARGGGPLRNLTYYNENPYWRPCPGYNWSYLGESHISSEEEDDCDPFGFGGGFGGGGGAAAESYRSVTPSFENSYPTPTTPPVLGRSARCPSPSCRPNGTSNSPFSPPAFSTPVDFSFNPPAHSTPDNVFNPPFYSTPNELNYSTQGQSGSIYASSMGGQNFYDLPCGGPTDTYSESATEMFESSIGGNSSCPNRTYPTSRTTRNPNITFATDNQPNTTNSIDTNRTYTGSPSRRGPCNCPVNGRKKSRSRDSSSSRASNQSTQCANDTRTATMGDTTGNITELTAGDPTPANYLSSEAPDITIPEPMGDIYRLAPNVESIERLEQDERNQLEINLRRWQNTRREILFGKNDIKKAE